MSLSSRLCGVLTIVLDMGRAAGAWWRSRKDEGAGGPVSFIAAVTFALIAAAAPQTAAAPASAPTPMSAAPARPQWLLSREGPRVVFRGALNPASGAALALALSDESVEGLVIDSGGGDENAALDAAEVILARRLPVTVRGQCTSACANAVFAAGATRTIERAGFVSFHHSSPVIEANYQTLNEAVPDEIARGARRLRALYAARGADPGILACAAAQIGLSDIQTQVTIPGEATPRAAWLSRHSLWLPHEATLRRYGLDFTRWGRPPSRRDVLARLRPPNPRAVVFGGAGDCVAG